MGLKSWPAGASADPPAVNGEDAGGIARPGHVGTNGGEKGPAPAAGLRPGRCTASLSTVGRTVAVERATMRNGRRCAFAEVLAGAAGSIEVSCCCRAAVANLQQSDNRGTAVAPATGRDLIGEAGRSSSFVGIGSLLTPHQPVALRIGSAHQRSFTNGRQEGERGVCGAILQLVDAARHLPPGRTMARFCWTTGRDGPAPLW